MDWAQLSIDDTGTNETREQNYEQNSVRRDKDKGRKISKITCKHLEQVISTMILLSTYSSSEPPERCPVKSMVIQMMDKNTEETETKKAAQEKEKQVIVNNYYISDKESSWKQLSKSEISPNT